MKNLVALGIVLAFGGSVSASVVFDLSTVVLDGGTGENTFLSPTARRTARSPTTAERRH